MQCGFCFGRCEDHSCQWSALLMLTFILICYDYRLEFLLTLYYLFTLPENALSASEVWVQLTVSVYAISPGVFEVAEIMFSLHR